jgi:hypothetical protein
MFGCSYRVLLCVATVSSVAEQNARDGKYCRARDAAGSGATPRMPGHAAQKYLGQCHQPQLPRPCQAGGPDLLFDSPPDCDTKYVPVCRYY